MTCINMDNVFTLLKILPYHKRNGIMRIINKKDSIIKKHQYLYLVRSSINREKYYKVSYYLAKKKFICNCEGFRTALEKINKQFYQHEIDHEQKTFLEYNFKCIHIYAVYVYFMKSNR